MMTPEMRPATVMYAVEDDGYTVSVYTKDGEVIDSYNAGNSPFDSSERISPDDKNAIRPEELLKKARSTAIDMAIEAGLTPDCIDRDEDLEDSLRQGLVNSREDQDQEFRSFGLGGI